MLQLLVIEDDLATGLALKTFFEKKDYAVTVARTGAEGLALARRDMPDIALLDLRLPDASGLEVLERLKAERKDILVYMMTAFGEIKEAVRAIKAGAENFLQKSMDLDELAAVIDKGSETVRLRRQAVLCRRAYPIIGRSKAVQGLIHLIGLMAENHSTTLLIQGETGTGKELVARNIHAQSRRGAYPFVDINCASIPESILESELLGYEPGAFTDARVGKKGLFELADRGTLFLDEIADMSPALQAKLLRVIETKTFRRLGGTKDIKVDVRVVAATNKDLGKAAREGAFREDLFYRLNVMPITTPPLRERPEDIPMLAGFFLHELTSSAGKEISGFDEPAMEALSSYDWPGNVRELRNITERAVILARGKTITASDITLSPVACGDGGQTIEDIVRRHIGAVLKTVGGNKTHAAKILGVARSTLIEKIKAYKVE